MPNQTTRSTVIPGLHYRNAPDAIDWLCRVFGFEKHAVYPGPDNTIMHAELTLGGGMIMLGSTKDSPGPGAGQSHGISLVVQDADKVYARARAAGAKMTEEIADKPYGGRGFACLDPEGHIWHVGTYDPWAPK
jgi:uncharacterized glyoxalase superfamily protein PhnB